MNNNNDNDNDNNNDNNNNNNNNNKITYRALCPLIAQSHVQQWLNYKIQN